jgi:hypothetical protein
MTSRDDDLGRWREELGRLARAVVGHLETHPDGADLRVVEALGAALSGAVDAAAAGDETALRAMACARAGTQRLMGACLLVYDLLDAARDQDHDTAAEDLRRALYGVAANAGGNPPRRLAYLRGREADLAVVRGALAEWCAIPRGTTIPKNSGTALHRLLTLYGIAPNGRNSLVLWSRPSMRRINPSGN